MWRRLIRWIARQEIAQITEAHQTAFMTGARDAYAEGYNMAMLTMQRQMEAARAELEFVRALFPMHKSHRHESKRVH